MKKILIPVLVLGGLFVAVFGLTSSTDKTNVNNTSITKTKTDKTIHPGHSALAIGDVAPDFKLKNVDDTFVSLASMEKEVKGYIVIFTCNHCPYAVMYEDRMIDLHNTYAPKGYPIIAINPNDPEVVPSDSFEAMKERAKEKAFPFVYLMDEGQKVYPQYGAKKTPHVFLLDKDRVVTYIGAIDDNHEEAADVKVKYLENAIAAMEKGVAADPSVTKAIGCSIKVKK